jgi:hypothetical protein
VRVVSSIVLRYITSYKQILIKINDRELNIRLEYCK